MITTLTDLHIHVDLLYRGIILTAVDDVLTLLLSRASL